MAEVCRQNGIPHILLLRQRTQTYQSRQVTTWLPIFPGYLFVALDAPRKLALQKTNNVLRFLAPDRPFRMLRQLAQIRRVLRQDPTLRAVKPLAPGRRVRIVAGPLMGVEGTVARLSATMRVALAVDMIGQAIMVHATREQVEPLD
jgi:transcriptional antiterminator RfaH